MDSSKASIGLLSSLGSVQTVVLSTLVAIFLGAIVNRFTQIRYPVDIPRIREARGSTRFSLRTRLAYYTDAKSLFREAYEVSYRKPLYHPTRKLILYSIQKLARLS